MIRISSLRPILFLHLILTTWVLCPQLSSAQEVNRLVLFGDSLSDDGGDYSTWFLLKTLNGLTGSEGIDYMKPWTHNWLSEKVVGYKELCSASKSRCNPFEENLLKAMVRTFKASRKIPVLPPREYDNGRWSNGPVWPEYLARMMGISTDNKERYRNESFAGSWSLCSGDKIASVNNLRGNIKNLVTNMLQGSLIPPCLSLIVQGYLARHQQFDEDDLIIIFFGGNDYINRFKKPERVVRAQRRIIELIIDNGGTKIAWLNMPNLALTPLFDNGGLSHKQDEVAQFINQHNQELHEEWSLLAERYSENGVQLFHVDANAIFAKVLENQQQYGFRVNNKPCNTIPMPGARAPGEIQVPLEQTEQDPEGAGSVCTNPDEYIFWDHVHPTTATHKIIATSACAIIREQGFECES